MEARLSTAETKAILLTCGAVKIGKDLRLPFPPSRSTAGPGAGTAGIVLSFGGTRVKKAISRERGDFELVRSGDGYALLRDDEIFLEKVDIQPTLFHSPEQAFFNVETECIYDCKFCSSRQLDKRITKNLTPDKIVAMIIEASKRPDFKAVALTSAVVETPRKTVDKMVRIVSRAREALGPGVPIGVEPYVSDLEDVDRLKAAGADEIKLNVETWDRDIFRKVCGELDIDWILKALEHAVRVFGKGRVCSNIIIGMGESDENVLDGVEALARIGVVASLRPLRLNHMNRKAMTEALGPLEPIKKDRLIKLAIGQKRILERYRLTTLSFRTMCNACTCCDIVPFRDI
jgi:biotin synthase-related radical SAM superfamily protein